MKNSVDLHKNSSNHIVIEPCIGLAWQPLTGSTNTKALNKNNLLTLSLIDVLEEQHVTQSESGHRSHELNNIDAKLNLLLHLVAQLLGHDQNQPDMIKVNLSAQDIEWLSETKPEQGQALLINLYLDNEYQHALRLTAQVQKVEAVNNVYRIKARFTQLDDALREQFEKWIFRYHRRDVAQTRSRS
ncbi:MAG: PilZ domain-containing protein [Gammaproteobacteria bacterium]|nr:PilZ domain-containing protein [Gammaproteobacteria bacterium]